MPCLAQWNYPATKTVDASDTYFGKTYNDPYRWLEPMNDKDVEAWFKAQAELTDNLLAKIPGRDALVQEYFDTFTESNGDRWLVVTPIVTDPQYLAQPFITSTHFKGQSDASGWNPTPCEAK